MNHKVLFFLVWTFGCLAAISWILTFLILLPEEASAPPSVGDHGLTIHKRVIGYLQEPSESTKKTHPRFSLQILGSSSDVQVTPNPLYRDRVEIPTPYRVEITDGQRIELDVFSKSGLEGTFEIVENPPEGYTVSYSSGCSGRIQSIANLLSGKNIGPLIFNCVITNYTPGTPSEDIQPPEAHIIPEFPVKPPPPGLGSELEQTPNQSASFPGIASDSNNDTTSENNGLNGGM